MIELMLTIEPPPVFAICSAASLVPRKTLVWLTAMTRCQPSRPSGSPTELPEIQGNRVKDLPCDQAGEEVVIPAGSLSLEAQ
jgi:hypothetical protein